MDRRTFLASASLAAAAGAHRVVGAATAPSGPVTFTVMIRVKPGSETEFLELLTPVLDAMRQEPTFLNAVLHRDPDDPTRFLVYESWADLDDVVEVQLKRGYRKRYTERLPDILAEPREIGVWSPLRVDGALPAGLG